VTKTKNNARTGRMRPTHNHKIFLLFPGEPSFFTRNHKLIDNNNNSRQLLHPQRQSVNRRNRYKDAVRSTGHVTSGQITISADSNIEKSTDYPIFGEPAENSPGKWSEEKWPSSIRISAPACTTFM
jgi:hypothetical protein